jgi:hypothetical protein
MVSFEQGLRSDGFLPQVKAPLQSACGGNYLANSNIHFFIDADQVTKKYYNSQTATIVNSVKDYPFEKIGCARKSATKNDDYLVLGALLA